MVEIPHPMAQIGQHIDHLHESLMRLQKLLEQDVQDAQDSGAPLPNIKLPFSQSSGLSGLLDEIKKTSQEVSRLLEQQELGILARSWESDFHKPFFALAWFDDPAENAASLVREIEVYRGIVRDYLRSTATGNVYGRRSQQEQNLSGFNMSTSAGSSCSPPHPALTSPQVRREYSVLFVDPYNTGRSVVAQALLNLLGHLTVQAGGDWRVSAAHSAGFFVLRQSECVSAISRLDYSSDRSLWKPWCRGGEPPRPAAMAVVFTHWARYPFTDAVRKMTIAHRSRGLDAGIFSDYDFIVAFTSREQENLTRLKAKLEAMHQSRQAEAGTGSRLNMERARVVQLGSYLPRKGGEVREILVPLRIDPAVEWELWENKMGEIKEALEMFLRQEVGWIPPIKGSSVAV